MALCACDGLYNPSFFTIYYDSSDSINTILDDENINTIIHEYIHFIQDICTTYGLANMSNVFSGIAHFYNDEKNNITLPFDFETPQYIFETNQKLFFYYFGGNCYEKFIKYSDVKIKLYEQTPKKEELDTEDLKGLRYHVIKLSCNKYGSLYEKKYCFGAQAIMECMSNIFEKHLGETFANTYYRIPYDLPELVIKHIYPQMAQKDSYIFALCDAAMLYFNPGDIFIKALKKMKAEKFIPQSLEQIYEFVSRFYPGPIMNLFLKTKNEALKNAKNIVNVREYRFAYHWVRNTVDHFYRKRKSDIAFLAHILDYDSVTSRIMFLHLIKDEISPLIFNKNNEVCFLGNSPVDTQDSSKLFFWFYISKINKYIFNSSSRDCPYMEICTDFNNCNYLDNPLLKPMCAPYCIFQQFAKCSGLLNKRIMN